MRQRLRGREWQVACLALLLVALVESGLLFAGGSPKSAFMSSSPPNIPLPKHTTLLRAENFLSEDSQAWYYSVSRFSVDNALPYYRDQAKRLGWRCFTSLGSTQIQQGGKPVSGTGMYITAISGKTFIQINTGSLAYGSDLVGDNLDDGTIGLEIVLESADNTRPCG